MFDFFKNNNEKKSNTEDNNVIRLNDVEDRDLSDVIEEMIESAKRYEDVLNYTARLGKEYQIVSFYYQYTDYYRDDGSYHNYYSTIPEITEEEVELCYRILRIIGFEETSKLEYVDASTVKVVIKK